MVTPRNELDRILSECKVQNILPLQVRCQFFLEGQEKQIFYILNPESFYAAPFLKIQMEHLKEFIEKLEKEAEHKPYQLILLGYGYEKGLGVDKDLRKAIECYTKSAESKSLGNAMLGRLYVEHFDFSRAEASTLKGTQLNNPLAERQAGLSFIFGRGVPQLPDEAITWLTKAAAQDDPIAQCELGTLLEEKKGDANIAAAKEQFKAAACNGNIDALAKLGYLLEDLPLTRYAKDLDNKYGFYYLGLLSRSITPLFSNGLEDIRQAAEMGCAEAFYYLFQYCSQFDIRGLWESKYTLQKITGTSSHLLSYNDAKRYSLMNHIPLEQFSHFMNEDDFKKIYEERKITNFNCVLALHQNLKKAGKEMFDPNLVRLVTEYITTPRTPVRDLILVEFKTANDTTLITRAHSFINGNHDEAFYFFTSDIYRPKRFEEEKKLLVSLIKDLNNSKSPLTTEQKILLGFGYENGIGVPKDEKNAENYYNLAAKIHPLGHAVLARFYQNHLPDMPLHENFLNHAQLAAEQREPMGMALLAVYYLYQSGNNPREGLAWLFKASEAEHPLAQLLFGLELLRQPFTKKETFMLKAKSLMENAARAGLPLAIYQLGKVYMGPIESDWGTRSLSAPPNWSNQLYRTPRRALDYFAIANHYCDYSLQQERDLAQLYFKMYTEIFNLAILSPQQCNSQYQGQFDHALFDLRIPAFFKCALHMRRYFEKCEGALKEQPLNWLKNRLALPERANWFFGKPIRFSKFEPDKTYQPVIDYHIALATNNTDLLLKIAQQHPDRFKECLNYEFSLQDRERICTILPSDIRKKFITEKRVLQRPEKVVETKHEAINLKAAVETKTEPPFVAAYEERQQQQPQQATPPETKRKYHEKKPTVGDIAHAKITAEHESEMKERVNSRKNRLIQFVEELHKHIGHQLTTADLSQSTYSRGSSTLFQNVKEPVLNQILSDLKNENPDFDQIKTRIAGIINEFKSKLIQEKLPDSSNKLNNLIEFLFANTNVLKNSTLFEKAKYLLIKPEQIEWCAKNLANLMQKGPDTPSIS